MWTCGFKEKIVRHFKDTFSKTFLVDHVSVKRRELKSRELVL